MPWTKYSASDGFDEVGGLFEMTPTTFQFYIFLPVIIEMDSSRCEYYHFEHAIVMQK